MKKGICLFFVLQFVILNISAQNTQSSKVAYRDSRVRDHLTPEAIVWKSDTSGAFIMQDKC